MKKISALFTLFLLSACFAGGETAYPLYSPSEQPLPRAEIATLAGPIESVDGQRVAQLGHSFALKPGCHEITNQTQWGGSDGMSASIAHLPELTYAVQMRAGYSYALEIGGGHAGIAINMTERNPNGEITRQFDAGRPCATDDVAAQ